MGAFGNDLAKHLACTSCDFDDAVLEAASQALAMSDQLVVKQIVLLYIHSQNDLDDHSDTDFKRLFETLKNNKTMERFHFRRCGHLMHW